MDIINGLTSKGYFDQGFGLMIDKQHFLGELERRCDVFLSGNTIVNNTCLEERDNLIRFAKAAVKLRVITKPEIQRLIDRVDQNMFGACEEAVT